MKKFCENCTNPAGVNLFNPLTGKALQFHETENGFVCEICYDLINSGSLPSREQFNEEFNSFLQNNDRILFAYSGGLDSTVTLAKLAPECKKRGIQLIIFTLLSGVKGSVAEKNISDVLNFFGLKDNHFYVDIVGTLQDSPNVLKVTGRPMSTLDVYRACYKQRVLPCGKLCNTMFDIAYDSVMKDWGFKQMVTGGDTPKKNSQGVYSLLWEKPSGITIVRGAYAFALSKSINLRFISENAIPWVNPNCGGYDTDCLVPGIFFAEGFNFQADQEVETVVNKYTVIAEYLTERVRFGVINYAEALKAIVHVDIASEESREELIKILGN